MRSSDWSSDVCSSDLNDHPCYAGDVGIAINPALAETVRCADLLIVVGARLGEMTTGGYTLVTPPTPKQRLVHVLPGAEELGRVYRPDLPILAKPDAFAAAERALPPHGRASCGERVWQYVYIPGVAVTYKTTNI